MFALSKSTKLSLIAGVVAVASSLAAVAPAAAWGHGHHHGHGGGGIFFGGPFYGGPVYGAPYYEPGPYCVIRRVWVRDYYGGHWARRRFCRY